MPHYRLPADLKDALIQVCGLSFHFKQPLLEMFARSGIPEDLYLQYEHEYKFTIARKLIRDLESMGEDGELWQRRLLTELCKLRTLPDSSVTDRDAGLAALRNLKRLAQDYDLIERDERTRIARRAADAEVQVQNARERGRRLEELYATFSAIAASPDPQSRGYDLEDLLKELFNLNELRYRKSYRAEGEQIDGFFSFGGFDYLVEARWRRQAPTLNDLSAFQAKVNRKIESTRGLFISVPGFDPDVVTRLKQAGPANLILMDGYDLTLILEGRVSLMDGLQAKIDRASQEGILYYPLVTLFA